MTSIRSDRLDCGVSISITIEEYVQGGKAKKEVCTSVKFDPDGAGRTQVDLDSGHFPISRRRWYGRRIGRRLERRPALVPSSNGFVERTVPNPALDTDGNGEEEKQGQACPGEPCENFEGFPEATEEVLRTSSGTESLSKI